MGIIMNIPFQHKDGFRKSGGYWDPELKTWYIPDFGKIQNFEMWFPDGCEAIVKTPFYLALSSRPCWKCGQITPLVAIGSDHYIQYEDTYDNEDTLWTEEHNLTLFSNVTYVPKRIAEMIQKEYPFFQYKYSKTIEGKYWGNTCAHCGMLQGDWFNHNEPDGAFFPCSPEEAKAITLIKKSFKYDFPIVGDSSNGTPMEFIQIYSSKK